VKVPRRGWRSKAGHFRPRVGFQIECKKVGFAFHTVVAALNVNVGVALGPGGAGARRRHGPAGLNLCPRGRQKVKDVHVVEPTGAVETAKEDEFSVVHNRDVTKATCRDKWLVGISLHLLRIVAVGSTNGTGGFLNTGPALCFNVVLPQVVQPAVAFQNRITMMQLSEVETPRI